MKIYRGEINEEQKKLISSIIYERDLSSLEEEELFIKYGGVEIMDALSWFQASNIINDLLGWNEKAA